MKLGYSFVCLCLIDAMVWRHLIAHLLTLQKFHLPTANSSDVLIRKTYWGGGGGGHNALHTE